jgi:hypothetical protein
MINEEDFKYRFLIRKTIGYRFHIQPYVHVFLSTLFYFNKMALVNIWYQFLCPFLIFFVFITKLSH